MGLTIHYSLSSRKRKEENIIAVLEKLRQRALDLPFEEVSELIILRGDKAKFSKVDKDDENGWMLCQAGQYVDVELPTSPPKKASLRVEPDVVIAFTAWPGEDCESSNFGLCLYPKEVEYSYYGQKMLVKTKLTGWKWRSFCKTQYANNHGIDHFMRCHTSVVAMLDYAKELGILAEGYDEGGFYEDEQRDKGKLAKEIGEWDAFIAGMAGQLKDKVGEGMEVEAPICERPDFEYLEAKGQEKLQDPPDES